MLENHKRFKWLVVFCKVFIVDESISVKDLSVPFTARCKWMGKMQFCCFLPWGHFYVCVCVCRKCTKVNFNNLNWHCFASSSFQAYVSCNRVSIDKSMIFLLQKYSSCAHTFSFIELYAHTYLYMFILKHINALFYYRPC